MENAYGIGSQIIREDRSYLFGIDMKKISSI